jgi:hypothetical protein
LSGIAAIVSMEHWPMTTTPPFPQKEAVEYIYKEYVRLNELCTAMISGSFDDFKLIGAVSVLLAWAPIVEAITRLTNTSGSTAGTSDTLLLLLGFIIAVSIIAILMLRDLLKQSLINFYVQQIHIYEQVLRNKLGETETRLFTSAQAWEQWRESNYKRVLVRYFFLFASIVIFIPSIILVLQEPSWYALVYLGVTITALAIYMSAVRVVQWG